MSTEQHRRIDHIRDSSFLADLEGVPMDELRSKRSMCDDLDTEIAYYRRMVHGRMDLLDFELRRRRGEEDRTLMEALPEILAGPHGERKPTGRNIPISLPDLPAVGRRQLDMVLQDDFLTHITDLSDEELTDVQRRLAEAEVEITEDRRIVFHACERLQAELTRRYRDGLADATELIHTD